MPNSKTLILKIKRQQSPESKPYWEEFELQYRPGMNVTSALMDIAAKPVTRDGKPTTPVTYDSNCLEEVCGSCAMLINGQAKMACSALIDQLKQPITLEPFSKFPIIRDLSVDRSVLFENLKQVQAWVPVDGTYDLGSGPRQTAEMQEEAYPLSVASPAAAAWKPARSSTTRLASSAQRPFPRCGSSILTPPARR